MSLDPGLPEPASASDSGPGLGISAVERDVGLSKDILRVWERRYAFPRPGRDAHGERLYPPDQVEKLRLIKRLMDSGLRPGKLVNSSLAELLSLIQDPGLASAAAAPAAGPDQRDFLALLKSHSVDDLRRALTQAVVRHGLGYFVITTVGPLNRLVGDAWMRGDIEVFEEHLYSESMQIVLRGAIASLARQGQTPRVLLTTFPNEAHGLGLLMAEALLALEGAHCISLGVQTPIRDIGLAAVAQRAQVVALSFSAAYPAAQVTDGLAQLRARLPDDVEIWAGGSAASLARRPPPGVHVLQGLEAIHLEVEAWRARSGR